IHELKGSSARAAVIVEFETLLRSAEMFADAWQATVCQHVRRGKNIGPRVAALIDALATLENVLRIRDGLAKLPSDPIRTGAAKLLAQDVSAEDGLTILRKAALAQAIAHRLQSDPRLQAADSQKLRSAFQKYSSLDAKRITATRAAVLHHWGTRQKERLL